ncbi:hypothetical protein O0L34_g8767 [Tuta absoluta]|nr:hypothetical protein O0L34_g8767 [Tuta absoluta]
MEENKVISSDITRDLKPINNNLYELIAVKPATPIVIKDVKAHTCDFQPITGKTYIPKKRIRLAKVKTVRDIRNLFETDISTDLSNDLEKQQNIILKKITCGSSREENTKSIARNMIKSDKPVSRSAWQMLMNVNTEGHPHAIQYVLWNGKRIRVNGSKGGKNTFLCNYDLANIKKPIKKETKRKSLITKKGLLQNSVAVKFKPGPLSRKKSLDDSFQKYNVGKTELVNIPKPGLHISPMYGVALEPVIAKFVQNLRDCDGTISEKWAEFAASVVGTVENSEPVQNSTVSGVTFELNYIRDQRRMLLRKDVYKVDEVSHSKLVEVNSQINSVENILKEILDSVEISLKQDNMYTGEDEPREQPPNKESTNVQVLTKEKNKKRFTELDKLDVTIIRLPDITENETSKSCSNAYCTLGCICASLQRSYHIKQHCSRVECMFECTCDFSKYKIANSFDTACPELIPGLINLDNKLSLNLAKEEQKFHQTVVLTGEKSIVLKSEKRNWKATKRYSDFYESMCLKTDVKNQNILSVADVKLNLQNVEPWCMVHNLYKCFCKGKFTHTADSNIIDETEMNETTSHDDVETSTKLAVDIKKRRSERYSAERNASKNSFSINSEMIDLEATNNDYNTCARTSPYKGRKFYNSYYLSTNKKILEMEENDTHLRKRLLSILSKSDDNDKYDQSKTSDLQSAEGKMQNIYSIESSDDNSRDSVPNRSIHESTNINNAVTKDHLIPAKNNLTPIKDDLTLSKDHITSDRSILNTTSNKSKLIAWLESSYKQYKQRIDQGIVKKSLDPPKHGKVALYPWEFILSRYRERKNLFLISQQKPFRIFMAVDGKNSFFNNCINIDEIRFADLHKYPVTVKNLLTNATDLKDNFCILCGLALCWELIGSVTKLDDQTSDTNLLQRVSDDKKIGFTAQDNKSAGVTETSQKADESVLQKSQIDVNVNNEEVIKPVAAIQRSASKKKGKKRKWNSKFKKILAKKTKTVANKELGSQNKDEQENNESEDGESSTNDKNSSPEDETESNQESIKLVKLPPAITEENIKELSVHEMDDSEKDTDLNSQSSKWFVMTVENDFSEIQFYNRGFFVKYESIIKAINVARMSGKTVRLSSQKSGDQGINCPQFGIYAIPNSNQYYVFIGPYDKDEPLGIETVKSFADLKKTIRTRGVWITTKKVDNVKVIDNPLSFMPQMNKTEKVFLENDTLQDQCTENSEVSGKTLLEPDSEILLPVPPLLPILKEPAKAIKPIKIRKTNGFYHLAPKGFLAHVIPKGQERSLLIKNNPLLIKNLQSDVRPKMPMLQLPLPNLYPKQKPFSVSKSDESLPQSSKPIAEIAPQIKIVDVYSETAPQSGSSSSKKSEGGMFILKPEEINKRLMANRLTPNPGPPSINTVPNSELDQDIENFLATSTVFEPPNADVFEISDEDDDLYSEHNWKNVCIECESSPIGYIKGRKRVDNMLSFEFPGFKFTDFYPEEQAYSKINQVLSRKVYVPKTIKLKWRVVESLSALKTATELKESALGPDIILTKRGLRHKQSLMIIKSKSLMKSEVDGVIEKMSSLEEHSQQLEEEGDKLLHEMATITKATAVESLLLQSPKIPDSIENIEDPSKSLQSAEIEDSQKNINTFSKTLRRVADQQESKKELKQLSQMETLNLNLTYRPDLADVGPLLEEIPSTIISRDKPDDGPDDEHDDEQDDEHDDEQDDEHDDEPCVPE